MDLDSFVAVILVEHCACTDRRLDHTPSKCDFCGAPSWSTRALDRKRAEFGGSAPRMCGHCHDEHEVVVISSQHVVVSSAYYAVDSTADLN